VSSTINIFVRVFAQVTRAEWIGRMAQVLALKIVGKPEKWITTHLRRRPGMKLDIEVTEYIDNGSNANLCPFCGGIKGECDEEYEQEVYEEYNQFLKEAGDE